MSPEEQLIKDIDNAFKACYEARVDESQITLQPTRKDFEGTHTLVCFPFLKITKQPPEKTAETIGAWLLENSDLIESYNVVKGFLNMNMPGQVWIKQLTVAARDPHFGKFADRNEEVMIEYSSPNTNKPLHLGHLRNNFLGWSVAEILKANGYSVHKVQIINDRGIHICKSMVAWKRFGDDATPESGGIKGDKLVGDFYVRFDREYKKEIEQLVAEGNTREEAEKNAPILLEAQEMLRKWEKKDPEVYALWERMNSWVYKGFDNTYNRMGVDFDRLYFESETFLLGKQEVLKGLEKGIFFEKEDGSVWVDLSEEGLDEKLLLRADGTSVYMTQDIGTAILRFRDFPNITRQIYTVGNEQEYHFKVLFIILDKLGYEWARECYHLSYGMVDLPTGKMKSREGTVVDADDLMQEMVETAAHHTQELGKIEGFTEEQARELYEMVGLGALKYFLLKVDPRKRMLFDPNESIQFQGNTAPFIQYTHARISAILRKADQLGLNSEEVSATTEMLEIETYLIQLLGQYSSKLAEAASNYAPDIIANYVYDLAKEYNRFYQEIPIFGEEDENKRKLRVLLSGQVARTIKLGMSLLGIGVPERM
ncbi:MAG: arginine--tRNA ligase [Cyclobacteriaceae bacterium]